MTGAESEHARGGLGRVLAQWPALVGLTLVWVLLWGQLSWGNVVGGLLLAVLVVVAFPLPPIPSRGTFRPVPFAGLLGRFVTDLVVASFQVAWVAVRPGPQPQGAVVQVRLRNPDDVYLTTTAVLSTLVPGTMIVEAERDTGMLSVHVLDIEGSGGPDGVRRYLLDLEDRVLRSFAPRDVLARCAAQDGTEGTR
ncbi:Na+/H+ antiporter subunit E [Isoptericola sp. AK164]|uniref:Na+/H+ antiporter subunit E n=1 Tax=Isoptericola sp. AK164 TaxID=3024246 RepID=UPI0024181A17|nr:Na+/H+ antiporter subunit E [Isoptericola sp. AK164]